MKPVIAGLITATVLFVLFYLMGSLVEASLDLREWDIETRKLVGAMGGICSLFMGACVAYFRLEEKGK